MSRVLGTRPVGSKLPFRAFHVGVHASSRLAYLARSLGANVRQRVGLLGALGRRALYSNTALLLALGVFAGCQGEPRVDGPAGLRVVGDGRGPGGTLDPSQGEGSTSCTLASASELAFCGDGEACPAGTACGPATGLCFPSGPAGVCDVESGGVVSTCATGQRCVATRCVAETWSAPKRCELHTNCGEGARCDFDIGGFCVPCDSEAGCETCGAATAEPAEIVPEMAWTSGRLEFPGLESLEDRWAALHVYSDTPFENLDVIVRAEGGANVTCGASSVAATECAVSVTGEETASGKFGKTINVKVSLVSAEAGTLIASAGGTAPKRVLLPFTFLEDAPAEPISAPATLPEGVYVGRVHVDLEDGNRYSFDEQWDVSHTREGLRTITGPFGGSSTAVMTSSSQPSNGTYMFMSNILGNGWKANVDVAFDGYTLSMNADSASLKYESGSTGRETAGFSWSGFGQYSGSVDGPTVRARAQEKPAIIVDDFYDESRVHLSFGQGSFSYPGSSNSTRERLWSALVAVTTSDTSEVGEGVGDIDEFPNTAEAESAGMRIGEFWCYSHESNDTPKDDDYLGALRQCGVWEAMGEFSDVGGGHFRLVPATHSSSFDLACVDDSPSAETQILDPSFCSGCNFVDLSKELKSSGVLSNAQALLDDRCAKEDVQKSAVIHLARAVHEDAAVADTYAQRLLQYQLGRILRTQGTYVSNQLDSHRLRGAIRELYEADGELRVDEAETVVRRSEYLLKSLRHHDVYGALYQLGTEAMLYPDYRRDNLRQKLTGSALADARVGVPAAAGANYLTDARYEDVDLEARALAPMMMRSLALHFDATRAYLEEASYLEFGRVGTRRNGEAEALYENALRTGLAVESAALDMVRRLDGTTVPWAEEWATAVVEVYRKKAEMDIAAKRFFSGGNPLGIDDDDVPLFFGDVAGDNSRYFAASDYLMSLAAPALSQSESSLEQARSAWLTRQRDVYSASMSEADRERRMDAIYAQYGGAIRDYCGLEMDARDALEAFNVLRLPDVPQVPIGEEFFMFDSPDRLTVDNCEEVRTQSCVEMRAKLNVGVEAEDVIAAYTCEMPNGDECPTEAEVFEKLCAVNMYPIFNAGIYGIGNGGFTATNLEKLDGGLIREYPHLLSHWLSVYMNYGSYGFDAVKDYRQYAGLEPGGDDYFAPLRISYVPGEEFAYFGAPTTTPAEYDAHKVMIPLEHLESYYRHVRAYATELEMRKANWNGEWASTCVSIARDCNDFFEDCTFQIHTPYCRFARGDHYSFADVESKCFELSQRVNDGSSVTDVAARLFEDVAELPSPDELSGCFRGSLGAAALSVESNRAGYLASVSRFRSVASSSIRAYNDCSSNVQIAGKRVELLRKIRGLQQASDAIGVMAAWGGAITSSVMSKGVKAPEAILGAAKALIDAQISAAVRDNDRIVADIQLQTAAESCHAVVAQANSDMVGAFETLRTGLFSSAERIAARDDLRRKLVQTVIDGRQAVGREKRREIEPFQHDLWLDERTDRYLSDFATAKRFVFLALRALEYEFQQSVALRQDVVRAESPAELRSAFDLLRREQATRTINRARPEQHSVVLSLRDDVLGEGIGNSYAERVSALREYLNAPEQVVRADGQILGNGVPFDLWPTGELEYRCGERLWSVTASLQGEAFGVSEPSIPMFLLKRNTFASQWCDGHGEGLQFASLKPSAEVLQEYGNVGETAETSEYSWAMLRPWLNAPRSDFYRSSYQEGASDELAGRGLFGEYVLLFPENGLLGEGFDLSKIEDVLLRFDYLSVSDGPGGVSVGE